MKIELESKIERNKEYKYIRNVLLKEKKKREKRSENYFYEPQQINFCAILFDKYSTGISSYPELLSKRPKYGWKRNPMFWFEPKEIEPRLAIIEKVIRESRVSLLDKILNRV